MKYLLPFFLFAAGLFGYTTDIPTKTASSNNTLSDTQAAVNWIDARNEDDWVLTVGTPSQSAGWSGTLSINMTHSITVQGAGDYDSGTAFEVSFSGGGGFYLNPHTEKLLRLSNFEITGSVSPAIEIEGGNDKDASQISLRIDHCKLYNLPDRGILINPHTNHTEGPLYALFDHVEWNNMDRAVYIHVSGADDSWTHPMSWGTYKTIMFEDCIFTNPVWLPGLASIDSTVQTDLTNGGLAGIRWAIRHSTVHNWQLTAHGNQHGASTTQVEMMHNTVTNNHASFWVYFNFRGGSITAFDNTYSADYGYVWDLEPDNASFQSVGQGVVGGSPGLVPCYFWGETYSDGDPVIAAGSLTEGVDYYFDTQRPGYTELAYPHPAISGVGDTTAPTVTSVSVAANGDDVTVNFSENATQNTYANSHWNLDASVTGSDLGLTYVSGDGTASWNLTVASTIQGGESVVINFDGTIDSIEDGAGNDLAAIVSGIVSNGSTQGADIIDPTLDSVVVGGNGITVTATFSESVTRGSGHDPSDWNLDATVTGSDIPLAYVSGDPGSVWILTAGSIIQVSSIDTTVVIDFNGAVNSIEDTAGNDLAAIVSGLATNSSSQGASGNTYYIDQSVGNDVNDGSEGAPWKNCPGMEGTSDHTGSGSLSADDTVYFDRSDTWLVQDNGATPGWDLVGGVHYVGDEWDPEVVGVSKAIIRAEGRCEAGVVRIWDDHATIHTILEGFDVDGNNQVANGIDINHRYSKSGGLTGALKVVRDCDVHDNYGDGVGAGDYRYGIIVSDNSTAGNDWPVANVLIEGCTMINSPRDGITIYPGDNGEVYNVTVRRNEVHTTGSDPSYSEGHGIVWKGNVHDSLVEYNYVHDVAASALFVNGPETGPGVGPVDVVAQFNLFHSAINDGAMRIFGTGTKSVTLMGNIIFENTTGGGLSLSGNSDALTLLVYNNTFYRSYIDFAGEGTGNTVVCRNNIVDPVSGTAIQNATGVTQSNNVTSGIVYKNASNLPTVFVGPFLGLEPNNDGLSIPFPSPTIIDAGFDLGLSFNRSVNSIARTTYDIGAYEYAEDSGGDPLGPSAPINLRVSGATGFLP